MLKTETRAFTFEVRADENKEHGHFLSGVPIVYDQRTDLGWYDEIIARGALDMTDLKDVRFLIGHDLSMVPLARSRNNNKNSTMQMEVGDKGMSIRVDLDIENNADSRKLYSATRRGDISGMSFTFVVDGDSWDDIDSDHPTRTIRSIKRVYEVSAVAFPAYEGTSLEARSQDAAPDGARASLESARAEAQKRQDDEKRAAAIKSLEKWRVKP
ncbi:MAG: HK97 family phage prohead protease [Clostridia bacterium]|nr:HK97 family phage prohead protease [Oscillospiraceae bacterium]MBR4635753.1 HK97 family phage prohead protease [Clostridia bacterium]